MASIAGYKRRKNKITKIIIKDIKSMTHISKKNNKTILFLILDAFRWDYCTKEDTPTLYNLGINGIWARKLVSSSGFTQRSAIFTGAPPDVHGNFTMYIYDSHTSPYKFLRVLSPLAGWFDSLPKSSKLFRFIKKVVNQLPKLTSDYAPLGWIPFRILPLISVTEDLKPIYKPSSFLIESIFDKLNDNNVHYEYLMAPVPKNDKWAMNKILSTLKRKASIYFLQFSDSDGIIHKVGSEGLQRRELMRNIDKRIERLKREFEKNFQDVWFLIIGDHGMMDVKEYIDIWNPVMNFAKSHKLILGKDFLMFLDSTLARFWFFNDRAQQILFPFLNDLLSTQGNFLTRSIAKEYRIPFNDKRYGDLIWRAHLGVGIFPDYFHSLQEKYKSMHGYDSCEEKMKGMAIIYNKNNSLNKHIKIKEAYLQDLCPTICDMLNLPYPLKNEGTSLLRRK